MAGGQVHNYTQELPVWNDGLPRLVEHPDLGQVPAPRRWPVPLAPPWTRRPWLHRAARDLANSLRLSIACVILGYRFFDSLETVLAVWPLLTLACFGMISLLRIAASTPNLIHHKSIGVYFLFVLLMMMAMKLSILVWILLNH